MKTGIVILARVQSSRLPGKVLQKIGSRTILEILLENIIPNNPHPVVLAIPDDAANDIVVQLVKEKNIPVEIFRGFNDSPSARMLAVAEKRGWEYVVRLTHDNPLVDPWILRQQIKHAEHDQLEYCYNSLMPQGTTGEVIRVDALKKILSKVAPGKGTEYLTYLLRQEGIRQDEFIPAISYQYKARLTVDYPMDLVLLRLINNSLASNYKLLDIINFLKRNRYLLELNRQPLISVVITNFNYAQYVVSAIASVVAQTEQDWELLIQDDCSTDHSLNKIMHYVGQLPDDLANKIKVFSSPKNMGLGAICNNALKRVRGKYYIRLDADDIFRTDALEVMRSILDADQDVQGVWSGYKRYDQTKETAIDVMPNSREYEYHPACCMLRTETVLATGYRERQEFYEGADFLKSFRQKYKIKNIQDDLWIRRLHDTQMTATVDEEKKKQIEQELKGEGVEL